MDAETKEQTQVQKETTDKYQLLEYTSWPLAHYTTRKS